MAKKFIDADLLKQECERTFDMQDLYLPVHFFDVVDDLPAADVQEVVRCKDCKYYFKSTAYNGYLCGMAVGLCDVDSDSYCSYGERKDGESQ